MINFHKKWIKNSYVKIKNEYQLLDKLDQELGDGDHGTTIFRGLENAVNSFKTIDQNEPIFFMKEISKTMRIAMGGASGILMSIFFAEIGNLQKLNSSILDILNNTIIKIKKRGNVKVGDKSILDVYVPIFNYLENNNQYQIDNLIKLIDDSVNKTKLMEANVGRAKFLETKGVGVIDPGALSTSMILKEFFKERNNEENI
tara:strand:+ start:1177 stop:1779 length:603 start_codon:yes stop_codon:yes gene_type:complete